MAAGDAERRRLERNLHDGAQQRLVSLALTLRMAARRHPDDDHLDQASEELTLALEELRELARGIHPAVLTERGLEPAVESLAARAPLPVEVSFSLGERLPGPVEAAAYYVVAEALTNVAKYACASVVSVGVGRSNGAALIEVRDDGVGGAAAEGGSGLRGLADRVEALGGRLESGQSTGRGDDAPRRDPRALNLTAAELLRSVTRALASADPLEALPGTLVRDAEGVLGWEGDVLSLPVPGVGVLRVRTGPPDEALEAAAESLAAQIEMARALQESSARRRAMLDVAFDSVVTMDADGVVVAANRAAERLFGYSAAEMVGRTVAELIVPPSLREAHVHGLARYLRTGRGPVVGRRVELTAMRADGSEFPVELVVTRPEVGGPILFYGYLRDLTSRYVAEASLHRLADEQAALRRVATAVAAEHESGAAVRAGVARRSGGSWRRGRRTCSASTPTGRAGRSSAAGRCRPSTCSRPGRGWRSTATRR